MEKQFAKKLQFGEEGYWIQMSRSNSSEDKGWIGTGWKVTDDQGEQYFRHYEKTFALQWLADHGYMDSGDGVHYVREVDLRKV